MKTTRRKFLEIAGAGALGATLTPDAVGAQAPAVSVGDIYDVAVVGAGVFGAWTAYRLAQAGRRVALRVGVEAAGHPLEAVLAAGETKLLRPAVRLHICQLDERDPCGFP